MLPTVRPPEKRRPHGLNSVPGLFGTVTILNMAFYGICGTMARIGLTKLTRFEYGGVLWSNIAGCIVMGLHPSIVSKGLEPIIAVGFCGSLTSFSTMMLQLFDVSTSRDASWSDAGYGVMAFLAFLFIQLQCPIVSFRFGKQLGAFLERYDFSLPDSVVLGLGAVAGVLSWAACIALAAAVPESRGWTLAGSFAPLGVLSRFYLGLLNKPQLRVGTSLSNLIATVIASVLTIVSSPSIATTTLQKVMVTGLLDGYCGTLSTVSSLVSELYSLTLRRAYWYLIISVGIGYCVTIIVIGSYKWTR